jgi:hypothetical protein
LIIMKHFPLWPLLVTLALVLSFWNQWMWTADSLLFGIPVNLLYHVALCVVASAAALAVTAWAWPSDADED